MATSRYTDRGSFPEFGFPKWPGCGRAKLSHTMGEDHQVVLYYRKGCHLCEVVKESLIKLSRRAQFKWQEVDVDSDPQLRRQFTDEVPVVFINGRKAFKYRIDEKEFLKKLAARQMN